MPETKNIIYEPLSDSALDAEKESENIPPTSTNFAKAITIPRWLAFIFTLLQIIVIFSWGISIRQCRSTYPNAQILYSPAQDAVEYKVVKFFSGLNPGEHPDIYSRPPSPEVDSAWTDLYECGISQIPEDQAVHLANSTLFLPPHSEDRLGYLVGIDVFHQLHCLNTIRKALHPDYYPIDPVNQGTVTREEHLAHCVNSLRQSLQCSADISTIVWQKRRNGEGGDPRFDIVHSCRNFEKIRQWALDHRAPKFTNNDL